MEKFIIFIVFEMAINIVFIVAIISTIIKILNGIKRAISNSFFKRNVIYQKDIDIKNDYLDVTLKDINTFNNQTLLKYKENYKDISKEKLELFNVTDINTLKDYFYNIFEEFEKAYNNLDYQKLKSLSTTQLYEDYYTGISLNLKSGNKRIIDNIKRKNVIIYELDSTIAKQVVSTLIEVSYWNYTIDKNGMVIGGAKDPVIERFIVQFRKDIKLNNNNNCPNCGAPIKNMICPYCDTVVDNKNEFKISSIKRIV